MCSVCFPLHFLDFSVVTFLQVLGTEKLQHEIKLQRRRSDYSSFFFFSVFWRMREMALAAVATAAYIWQHRFYVSGRTAGLEPSSTGEYKNVWIAVLPVWLQRSRKT
jgi:hypothetical protein